MTATITAADAAARAGRTVDTIRHWCRMGAVRATKVAGRWVIERLQPPPPHRTRPAPVPRHRLRHRLHHHLRARPLPRRACRLPPVSGRHPHPGEVISELYVDPVTWVIANVETAQAYRGEGMATSLYHAALAQLPQVLHARARAPHRRRQRLGRGRRRRHRRPRRGRGGVRLMAYYQIYWDAIRALPARQQLEVLADIAATVPVEMARERVRVVGRTVERHAAERPWGAQSRAAAELGLTKSQVGTTRGTRSAPWPPPATKPSTPWSPMLGPPPTCTTTSPAHSATTPTATTSTRSPRTTGDAINEHLSPHGITLAGDKFAGPYPRPENAAEVIAEAVEDVDLWEIVARHDTAA